MPLTLPRARRILPLLLVLATVVTQRDAHAQAADSAIVADARAFMEGYANDLRTGDREAIAQRHHRGGATIIFNGERRFAPWEEIRAQYADGWTPPAAFEFRDLVYEPAGADGVVVHGEFYWTVAAGTAPERFTYTSLLLRQDGRLRIRLEVETYHPILPAPPATPPAP
jgi:hypothetical protein